MTESAERFNEKYEKYINIIESKLEELFRAGSQVKNDKVAQAALYSLMAGGKRIRPVMMIAAADMFGVRNNASYSMACAVEMIHTYSLIHDDLPSMDDDNLRRGRPTCHIAYGEGYAVLAGDALLNRAYELILNSIEPENCSGSLAAGKIIAESAGLAGMIAGQSIDLESENKSITYDELVKLHAFKTGAMIKAPLLAAAALAEVNKETRDVVEKYAAAIGLAFQIQDDILDVTADQNKLGKTIGKDARDNKATYVSLLGLKQAKNKLFEADQEARSALEELAGMQLDTAFFRGMTDFLLKRNY